MDKRKRVQGSRGMPHATLGEAELVLLYEEGKYL